MSTPIQVSLEFTPNPNTLKFVVSQRLVERGAANFVKADEATGKSPLAEKLFAVTGVQAVLLGSNFVTITKAPEGDWDVVAEKVPDAIQNHLQAGEPVFAPGYETAAPSSSATGVEAKIREILDTEIRPAVAMDGGDITFGKFEDGVVYLHLQGACSSCPSSVATLKMGVETRLKEMIPEVKEVVQV